jgi:hypothetical protein
MSGLWFACATLAIGAVVAWVIKNDKSPVEGRRKTSKRKDREVP